MKAYYYATKTRKFLEVGSKRYPVSGVRAARKLAADLGAQPWNF